MTEILEVRESVVFEEVQFEEGPLEGESVKANEEGLSENSEPSESKDAGEPLDNHPER